MTIKPVQSLLHLYTLTKQLEGIQESIVGRDVVETRGNQLMEHVSRHQGQDEAVGQSEGGDREQVNWAGWGGGGG